MPSRKGSPKTPRRSRPSRGGQTLRESSQNRSRRETQTYHEPNLREKQRTFRTRFSSGGDGENAASAPPTAEDSQQLAPVPQEDGNEPAPDVTSAPSFRGPDGVQMAAQPTSSSLAYASQAPSYAETGEESLGMPVAAESPAMEVEAAVPASEVGVAVAVPAVSVGVAMPAIVQASAPVIVAEPACGCGETPCTCEPPVPAMCWASVANAYRTASRSFWLKFLIALIITVVIIIILRLIWSALCWWNRC
jgi:hypothetical protein